MIPFLKDFFYLTIDLCGFVISADLPDNVKTRVDKLGVYDLIQASESQKCIMVLTKSTHTGPQFFDYTYMGTSLLCLVAYAKKHSCYKIYGCRDDFSRRGLIKKTLQTVAVGIK